MSFSTSQSGTPARSGSNRLLSRVCTTAAAVVLFTTAGAAQDKHPTAQGSTDFGVSAALRLVQTGLGPAPYFTLKDDGADFVTAGTTTRASTGIADPFVLVMPAIPGVEVRSIVQWNWLLNGPAPAADSITVNGTVVTGTLCGVGTPDLCWGKEGAAAYIALLPAGLVVTGGANIIGGATDRAVGADPLALGEGLSLLTVYRVAGAPPRNVDLYCGYTSNLSGTVYGFADAAFAFSNVYLGGLAHYFLNGLDTQNPVPGWEDSFFINGLAVGGAVPGTFPNTNAWQGLLGPLPINNLYDHADGPLGAPFLTPGDIGLTSTTTFGPLGGGDCVGHSFGGISFSIKEVYPKWSQLPKDLDEGFDVPSNLDWYQLAHAQPGDPGPGPNIVTADDFQSDGRPITCVRFWGSYIDPNFIPNLPNQPTVALGDRGVGAIGACCLPDGSCTHTDQIDCDTVGGEYQGDNTMCPPNGCFGACCFDLDCTQSSKELCEAGAGVWQGYGVPCDPNPCDQTGTCLPDAAGLSCTGDCPPGLECVPRCIEFDPQFPDQYRVVDCDCRVADECQVEAIAGTDPQCIFGFCPDPNQVCERTETFDPTTGRITVCCDCVSQGACCVPGIPCFITTANDCAIQGGSYQGDNVPCVPDPCGQEVGACCLPDGTCIVTTAIDCGNRGGIYQGDGTVCGIDGACCLPSGLCVNLFEICCEDAGGHFVGGPCLGAGACCFADGTCSYIDEVCCLDQGGSYQGAGVPCNNPNPCIEPPFGACCLPDGTCIIIGPTQCQGLGGIYQGDNVPCSPNPCIDDGSEIDGWLISFHTDLPEDQNPDGFSKPERLLALYFAPANAVSIIPTSLVGCDGHRVYEYLVELQDACLIHTYEDPRPGAQSPLPGQSDAFYETAGFIYWLDIQAVVGHTLVKSDVCPNCTCDLNNDGVCDIQDLALLQSCFGALPIGACAPADINCDGAIDTGDVSAWQCLAAGNPPDVCCGDTAGDGCIEVVTEHFAEVDFWGWHTSRDHWNDNSTWGPVVMGPPPTMDWLYPDWTPVPPLCGPNMRIDQAFELLTPEPPCPPCPDFTGPNNGPPDGVVNLFDLLAMLDAWGPCPAPCPPYCPGDVNCDCVVNLFDLLQLLDAWGPCPPTP